MDNVVTFPKPLAEGTGLAIPTSMAEVRANLEVVKHVYVNEMTEVLISTLIQQMMTGGFDILADNHKKDFAFLIETVRSSLCKTIGVYHPFQDVSEKIMEEHGDDPDVLTIAKKIDVKFQDESEATDEPVSETSP